jgi:polysaccharide export outer membrane protein
MNIRFTTFLLLIGGLLVMALFAGAADEAATAGIAITANAADGNGSTLKESPALTGVRRPLYRLRKSDVVEVRFTFSPEFDQTLTVQPDGFIAPKAIGDIVAEGLTIAELRDSIRQAYAPVLRDPEVSVMLRDFEKPFFLAGGQVARPGKYELRSPTTVTEAIAIAGGFTDQSRHSQVVLFRKITDGIVETHVLNVKTMLAARNLDEDVMLKPGDMLFVPQNRISKIRKFLPMSSLSAFVSPAQF